MDRWGNTENLSQSLYKSPKLYLLEAPSVPPGKFKTPNPRSVLGVPPFYHEVLPTEALPDLIQKNHQKYLPASKTGQRQNSNCFEIHPEISVPNKTCPQGRTFTKISRLGCYQRLAGLATAETNSILLQPSVWTTGNSNYCSSGLHCKFRHLIFH